MQPHNGLVCSEPEVFDHPHPNQCPYMPEPCQTVHCHTVTAPGALLHSCKNLSTISSDCIVTAANRVVQWSLGVACRTCHAFHCPWLLMMEMEQEQVGCAGQSLLICFKQHLLAQGYVNKLFTKSRGLQALQCCGTDGRTMQSAQCNASKGGERLFCHGPNSQKSL